MKYQLLIFVLTLSTKLFAQHWNTFELAPMPERISNNAVCEGFVNGVPYVYSFAGIDSTKTAAGIHLRSYRYNTLDNDWEAIASLPDTLGKIAASANRVGDVIYIIGGYHVFPDGSEISSDRVHRYHIPSNSFLSDGAPIPVPIDDQVQVVYKDSLIYVVTGWSNSQNVNDVQIYDVMNDQWSTGTPITWMEQAVFGGAGAILGDTIYFYGGARNGDFSMSNVLRKGEINPTNPNEISWSSEFLSSTIKAYRSAATTTGNEVYFIGGSDQTYNYDGLAYSNGQGVNPNNRSFLYRPLDAFFAGDESQSFPMDLRGIANVNDTIKYLAGGMLNNQEVSRQLLRLEWNGLTTNTNYNAPSSIEVSLYPNPTLNRIFLSFSEFSVGSNFMIRLSSELGNTIQSFKPEQPNLTIDMSPYPTGMYFLEITNNKSTRTLKVMKL
jgi:hypothetical protein